MGEFLRHHVPTWLAYADTHGIEVEGRGVWRSILCGLHGDTHASLRINTNSGGWCCMACGAKGGDVLAYHMQLHGLPFVNAARDLGAWDDSGNGARPSKATTLSARDAMQLAAFELQVAQIVISDIRAGVIPSDDAWQRFLVSAGRVGALATEYRT